MICKGCKKALAENEPRRMVAEWPFCEACFQKLFDRASTSEEASPLPVEPKEEPACCLCGAVITGKNHKVGLWLFCDPCHADLSNPPLPKSDQKAKADIEDEEVNADQETEPVGQSPLTIINCSVCGRGIPLGGSRESNGYRYCPECVVALSVPE